MPGTLPDESASRQADAPAETTPTVQGGSNEVRFAAACVASGAAPGQIAGQFDHQTRTACVELCKVMESAILQVNGRGLQDIFTELKNNMWATIWKLRGVHEQTSPNDLPCDQILPADDRCLQQAVRLRSITERIDARMEQLRVEQDVILLMDAHQQEIVRLHHRFGERIIQALANQEEVNNNLRQLERARAQHRINGLHREAQQHMRRLAVLEYQVACRMAFMPRS